MRSIDGLSARQFLVRASFSIAVTAVVGLGSYFLIKFLLGLS
jgi:hypothetical protein